MIVDDLDRCDDKKIISLIDSIRVMLDDPQHVIDHAETVVIGNSDPIFGRLVEGPMGCRVVDLVRVTSEPGDGVEYHGICW